MQGQTAKQLSPVRQATRILPVWIALFALIAGGSALLAQDGHDVVPDEPSVLDAEPLEQYRAYRRMHAKNEKFDHEAWLDAWTEFDGHTFRYQIVSERGSEYVLDKVLRKVLAKEQQLIADGQSHRAELSADNYDFVEPASHGGHVRYVLLKPKRKDILLVDGRMVLNEAGTELLRVEGRLAKNPSFWTSLVNVIREFGRVNGVRVPVTTESIAKIRFAGLSRMTVHYEYESVNGQPVNVTARYSTGSSGTAR
jgi:hypothetical protein